MLAQSLPFDQSGNSLPANIGLRIFPDYIDRPPEILALECCAFEGPLANASQYLRERSDDWPRISRICKGFTAYKVPVEAPPDRRFAMRKRVVL